MRILIDIGHPAHVHLFKNFYFKLKEKHSIFFSVRDIKIAKDLLNHYEIPFIDLGKKKNSKIGKAYTVLKQDFLLYNFVRKNKIEIGLSSGIVLSHLSKITKIKSIVMDDDDDASETGCGAMFDDEDDDDDKGRGGGGGGGGCCVCN